MTIAVLAGDFYDFKCHCIKQGCTTILSGKNEAGSLNGDVYKRIRAASHVRGTLFSHIEITRSGMNRLKDQELMWALESNVR